MDLSSKRAQLLMELKATPLGKLALMYLPLAMEIG
jgi:hypothetical protein